MYRLRYLDAACFRSACWRGANAAHKLRGKAEIPPRKAKRARKNRDQMRYVLRARKRPRVRRGLSGRRDHHSRSATQPT